MFPSGIFYPLSKKGYFGKICLVFDNFLNQNLTFSQNTGEISAANQ